MGRLYEPSGSHCCPTGFPACATQLAAVSVAGQYGQRLHILPACAPVAASSGKKPLESAFAGASAKIGACAARAGIAVIVKISCRSSYTVRPLLLENWYCVPICPSSSTPMLFVPSAESVYHWAND